MRTQEMLKVPVTFAARYLAAAFAVLLAAGCMDNDLDLLNPNERPVEAFWLNEADAIAAMNGVYRTLNLDGTYSRNRYWMWARTDTYMSRSPAGAIQNGIRGVITDLNYGGFLGGMWQDPWRGIFRANQVIHNVPDIPMDEALKARLIAEAKFLRALYHFESALLFGDVPIILDAIEAGDNPDFRARDEVFQQVITDATEAAQVLPWRYTGNDTGRATRGGALALAGETQMMLGRWAEGAATLQQIVDSDQYSLLSDFATLFTMAGQNSAESLFEVQMGDNQQSAGTAGVRGNVNPRLVAPNSGRGSNIGFNDVQPTDWAFLQFFEEGGPWPNNPDPRLEATIFWNDPTKPGGGDVFGMPFQDRYVDTGPAGRPGFRDAEIDQTYFMKKYQEHWRTSLVDFDNPINIKVYRYGKVLLLLAEALTETGDLDGAAEHLNTLRARVGLPPVPSLNQSQMRDWINRELIMELFWEHSSRLKYMARHGLQTKEYLEPRNPFHASTFVNGKHHLIPIPQAEIDRNRNARQNPGW